MQTFLVSFHLWASPRAGPLQSPAEKLAALGSDRPTQQKELEERRLFTKPCPECGVDR